MDLQVLTGTQHVEQQFEAEFFVLTQLEGEQLGKLSELGEGAQASVHKVFSGPLSQDGESDHRED